jgi:hypothetical protein
VQNGFLTVEHNAESKAIFSVLLAHSEADGETLSWIVTADTPWSIVLNLRKKKSTYGMALSSVFLEEKIQKVSVSRQGKVMTTVFWDCEWVLLVDVVPKGEMINSDAAYIRTLTEISKCCK